MDIKELTVRPAHSSETGQIVSLYMDYMQSLSPYDESLNITGRKLKHAAKNMVLSYAEGKNTRIFVILLDKLMIGFFVTGDWPQAYTTDDVYIIQYFITRPYQRKGYGKKAFILYTHTPEYHHLTDAVSFFVLNGNPACMFWNKVMEELGYVNLVESGKVIPPTKEDMDELPNGRFYYWSPLGRGAR